MDRLGELAREFQIGLAGFAPDQIGVRGIGQAAADRLVEPIVGLEEAFDGALAVQNGLSFSSMSLVSRSARFGIGARHDQGRHAEDIGGQARGVELLDGLAGRHQHLAAHVPALLDRCQLVLEVHAGGAGLDHGLHQLEGIQHAAEPGFGIGHDRLQEIDVVIAFGMVESGRRAAGCC
jgi:hypothetical protein